MVSRNYVRDCLVKQSGCAGRLVGGRAGAGLLDPVVGNALRAVGDGDRAALFESEGRKCAPHWCVVLVGVAAQVVSVRSCEHEDRPSDTASAHSGHAVNDVVVGVASPCAVSDYLSVV